ncbi:hypothetical protein [Leucobacter denitrificans]|uniref:DUF3618 domain-containing protein n=1 Tax=Leucobacter denitrificans TaxID=683042 RepID=A0A7G9S249_9MICO|nr:hypothetical protein [Leucobacter denitrificans]QNN61924.1 hypothetical protein H9L06_06235 [Leucobacter denitrificans]
MNKSKAQGIIEAELARADLYDTLGQLRDRLNYAQRFDDAVDRVGVRIQEVKEERPAVFAAGVVVAAAAVGAVVWAVASGIAKRIR